jgi:hypothetical protein
MFRIYLRATKKPSRSDLAFRLPNQTFAQSSTAAFYTYTAKKTTLCNKNLDLDSQNVKQLPYNYT